MAKSTLFTLVISTVSVYLFFLIIALEQSKAINSFRISKMSLCFLMIFLVLQFLLPSSDYLPVIEVNIMIILKIMFVSYSLQFLIKIFKQKWIEYSYYIGIFFITIFSLEVYKLAPSYTESRIYDLIFLWAIIMSAIIWLTIIAFLVAILEMLISLIKKKYSYNKSQSRILS